jgi:hypothetical protein
MSKVFSKQISRHNKRVNVFMDFGACTEWIATFDDEETYAVCLPPLEKLAKEKRGEIIERVDNEDES